MAKVVFIDDGACECCGDDAGGRLVMYGRRGTGADRLVVDLFAGLCEDCLRAGLNLVNPDLLRECE